MGREDQEGIHGQGKNINKIYCLKRYFLNKKEIQAIKESNIFFKKSITINNHKKRENDEKEGNETFS